MLKNKSPETFEERQANIARNRAQSVNISGPGGYNRRFNIFDLQEYFANKLNAKRHFDMQLRAGARLPATRTVKFDVVPTYRKKFKPPEAPGVLSTITEDMRTALANLASSFNLSMHVDASRLSRSNPVIRKIKAQENDMKIKR